MVAVAVLDNGISNSFNATVKRSIFERDYVFNDNETDFGVSRTHGTIVAEAVVRTNARLDLIDARVADNIGQAFSSDVEEGLQAMISLANQGYRIGAINYSYGSATATASASYQDELDILAGRGVFLVAASGNSGFRSTLETPDFPGARSNVIAVGSHNGAGVPSAFSQQGRGRVVVLADGEDFPAVGENGTSFAAPQVAATVATVQGTYLAATGQTLNLGQMIDVLQQGGRGPLSAPDSADGVTRYFLHDHNGSVDYAVRTYVDPNFSPYEYLASYADLRAAFGLDGAAARDHFFAHGVHEGCTNSFDAMSYTASYGDLRVAFGTNRDAAALHYLNHGLREGRTASFDGTAYLNANSDLAAAFGTDTRAAARHYVQFGAGENRPLTVAATTVQPTNESGTDFVASTATAGRMVTGRSVTGTISSASDTDWYRIELTAGRAIIVEVKGSATGSGTLSDPTVGIRNAGGALVAFDDDGGTGLNSLLRFTPTASGFHYIEVDGFSTTTGTYTLSVASASGMTLPPSGGDATDQALKVDLVGVDDRNTLDGYLAI
jgi:hypothetical protein